MTPPQLRIGHGLDFHAFCDGDGIILGGIKIPHSKGLLGHSDADVLTHAVMDALLGAVGAPDIGVLFPNDDPALKGASSIGLLKIVMEEVSSQGFTINNIDTVIISEAPKVSPYRDKIIASLAEALGVSVSQVGVKASTAEKLGSLGRGEGAMASAVVLLQRS